MRVVYSPRRCSHGLRWTANTARKALAAVLKVFVVLLIVILILANGSRRRQERAEDELLLAAHQGRPYVSVAIVTPCQPRGVPSLCIKSVGPGSSGVSHATSPLAPQLASGASASTIPSCAASLAGGQLLAALALGYDRVIVRQPGSQLLPMHMHAMTLPHPVFSHPQSGSPLSAVWAAAPTAHRRFFQLGCDLLADQQRQREADWKAQLTAAAAAQGPAATSAAAPSTAGAAVPIAAAARPAAVGEELGERLSVESLFQALSFGAAYFAHNPHQDAGGGGGGGGGGGASWRAQLLSPPSPTATPGPPHAYATLLTSTRHDWYVESVRMLHYSLRHTCASEPPTAVVTSTDGTGDASTAASTTAVANNHPALQQPPPPPPRVPPPLPPLVVMVPRSLVDSNTSYLELLRQEGMVVHPVEPLSSSRSLPGRFADVWAKQRLWGLTAYQLVAYLDPDQVLLRCPNALFAYPPWSHARTAPPARNHFNSGVLVIRPSADVAAAVEAAVRGGTWANDQAFTQAFFQGRGYELPEFFSFWKRHATFSPSLWAAFKHCSALLHFTGEKPWEPPAAPGTLPAVLRYWAEYAAFKEVHPAGPRLAEPYPLHDLSNAESTSRQLCPLDGLDE